MQEINLPLFRTLQLINIYIYKKGSFIFSSLGYSFSYIASKLVHCMLPDCTPTKSFVLRRTIKVKQTCMWSAQWNTGTFLRWRSSNQPLLLSIDYQRRKKIFLAIRLWLNPKLNALVLLLNLSRREKSSRNRNYFIVVTRCNVVCFNDLLHHEDMSAFNSLPSKH